MTAGNAVFTITSLKSNRHLSYKVRENKLGSFYVYAGRYGKWEYLGYWKPGNRLIAKYTSKAIEIRAFNWLIRNLDKGALDRLIAFHHEGRCARCGRPLTDPVSIEVGMGPSCRKINYSPEKSKTPWP